MKAITICQPYAWLISLPTSDPRHKRVENRTWYTAYRGPILIHAGKSRDWLDTWEDITDEERARLVYGAIVAKANLVACLDLPHVQYPRPGFAWVRRHQHTEGPWCWILEDIQPMTPIYCPGHQMLWDYAPQAVPGGLFR